MKPNYKGDKKRREEAKRKKKEEKRIKRLARQDENLPQPPTDNTAGGGIQDPVL